MWDMEYLANLAEIIGAAVVVITLIYLTAQLRQNNHLLRSESRRAMTENERTALVLALEHQEVFRKLNQSEELSAKEQFQLSILFIMDLENRFFEFRQYKYRVLDEQSWRSRLHILVENHGTTRGQKWWTKIGRQFYPSEFVQMVDELIRDEKPIGGYQLFASWDDEK